MLSIWCSLTIPKQHDNDDIHNLVCHDMINLDMKHLFFKYVVKYTTECYYLTKTMQRYAIILLKLKVRYYTMKIMLHTFKSIYIFFAKIATLHW
jgi:hypothetical protein